MPRKSTPSLATAQSAPSKGVRVFVSYSHDSKAHAKGVFQLADRLRLDGINCELDQFEEAPPEGWPQWMATQIRKAKFVVVVCTAPYHRRVTGQEQPGVGLGAKWEGSLITQALYERGGRNDKFIPVVLKSADLEDIPDFLQHTTHYDLSKAAQYVKLLRRLTDQPLVVKRPIGSVRHLPPENYESAIAPDASPTAKQRTSPAATRAREKVAREKKPASLKKPARPQEPTLALIREPSGPAHFIPLVSVEAREDATVAILQPATGLERAFLESLAARRFGLPTVDFVFGLTSLHSRLDAVVRTFEGGQDRFTISLSPDRGPQGNVMEMATNDVSADEIATMRARRILLDERPAAPAAHQFGYGNSSMLEPLIRGLESEMSVERSPLPELYRNIGATGKAHFIAAAKLTAVLWLRLTGTVANVYDLELQLKKGNKLAVRFRGARARVYTNKEPENINIEGVCPLA